MLSIRHGALAILGPVLMGAFPREAWGKHVWQFFVTRGKRIEHGMELFNRQIPLRCGARSHGLLQKALRRLPTVIPLARASATSRNSVSAFSLTWIVILSASTP